MTNDLKWMDLALKEAGTAEQAGEIPVGAVIVGEDGTLLATAHNLCETNRTATAHAELLAIEEACRKTGSRWLFGSTLYVTLEPCPMCMGAIVHARIGRVVYGAKNPREGACGSLVDLTAYPLECKPETVGGVCAGESLALLRHFFDSKRTVNRS